MQCCPADPLGRVGGISAPVATVVRWVATVLRKLRGRALAERSTSTTNPTSGGSSDGGVVHGLEPMLSGHSDVGNA